MKRDWFAVVIYGILVAMLVIVVGMMVWSLAMGEYP